MHGGAGMTALADTRSWARRTFEECELGDRRRTRRLIQVAERIAENPAASFPDQLESWAQLKAAYRLFDADDVTLQTIATPHWELTRATAAPQTLVLCDTTELNFGRFRLAEGLGPTGKGRGRGFLLHNALMVDADKHRIVGVAGQTVHYRSKPKKNETRTQQLKRVRESGVWGRVIDEIGPPHEGVRYVYVCDRGADNFEVFCHLVQQDSGWIIRARAKNRNIITSDGAQMKLGECLPSLPVVGAYELSLRTRREQPARTAQIEVSCGSINMPVPRIRSPWLRSLSPEPIGMNVVLVREVDAPADVTPIEWVLLTTEPVTTFSQAWNVIEGYEARWLIEEYHKALKSGTSVKKRQLQTADRLEAMVGLMSVVAVHLLQLKTLSRTDPDCKASRVVPRLWLQMLKASRPKLKRVHDLTIHEFYRELAKLGGFIGRRSDGEPGWITIWRGWEKLARLVQGAKHAKKLFAYQ